MENIIEYLKVKYDPEAIIVYGSYADGSNNANSDFDALVITTQPHCGHDTSSVGGILLDVFLYSPDAVSGEIDCEDFLQIHDGIIVLDKNGTAARLQKKVQEHIASLPKKSRDAVLDSLAWCEKMLLRTERMDTEGYFRWHWLLTESLEIYCDVCGKPYFGPKKSIRQMEKADPEGYRLYAAALETLDHGRLKEWISYLKQKGSFPRA